jgi:hypothetical protein
MKPPFLTLKRNHYSSANRNPDFVDAEGLYSEIGYDFHKLVKENGGFENTCATRMSLALVKSNVNFRGRLRIKSGAYKGKTIEPGAKLLPDQLALGSVFGRPSILESKNAATALLNKKGVIFFDRISGYNGGHIDLIEPSATAQVCHSHCYFNCKQVWFWPLN